MLHFNLLSSINKFSPRAHPCVFPGYPKGYKGYKVYDLITKKFQISRDVVFYENIFPFQSEKHNKPASDLFTDTVISIIPITTDIPEPQQPPPAPQQPPAPPLPPLPAQPLLRRSNRIIRPPTCLNDFFCNQTSTSKYPITHHLSYHKLQRQY